MHRKDSYSSLKYSLTAYNIGYINQTLQTKYYDSVSTVIEN